jgi:hypothetical protein
MNQDLGAWLDEVRTICISVPNAQKPSAWLRLPKRLPHKKLMTVTQDLQEVGVEPIERNDSLPKGGTSATSRV